MALFSMRAISAFPGGPALNPHNSLRQPRVALHSGLGIVRGNVTSRLSTVASAESSQPPVGGSQGPEESANPPVYVGAFEQGWVDMCTSLSGKQGGMSEESTVKIVTTMMQSRTSSDTALIIQKITGVEQKMTDQSREVEKQMTGMETRLEQKITGVEQKITGVEQQMNGMETRIASAVALVFIVMSILAGFVTAQKLGDMTGVIVGVASVITSLLIFLLTSKK